MYVTTMNRIEDGELSPPEREAVILAVSRYNDCHYCTRTHAKLGLDAGLSQEAIQAIHRGGLLLDKQGWLSDDEREAFQEAGIGRTELYEINALIGLKIFSNYVNHVAQTEVDDVVTEDPEIQEMWPVLGQMEW
jgi:AhpD family alkylhydroperoxidase